MKFKRKKNDRQRASKTHGWGSMKKNRGAGNRGGRGNAGTGKRGDANKPKVWSNKKYFGKHGFTSINKKIIKSCNIQFLENSYINLIKKGMMKEENGVIVVDLKQLGYDKLLNKGKVTQKFKISVPYASAGSIEKIKKAGGEVILTFVEKAKKEVKKPEPVEQKEE